MLLYLRVGCGSGLYNGQNNEVLRFAVEGQLDLGDFQATLHKHNDIENYADKVEGQKITFQFRGDLLNETLETIHNHINGWLNKNGYPQLDTPESQPILKQIEFGLEYGQTYDPVSKTLVTQIVGLHIDCPWPILSSLLNHPEPLNFLSASRIPPLHYVDDEIRLPEAPNENQFGYMEWYREWYWESDFALEKLAIEYDSAMQEDSDWRDVAVGTIEGFLPVLLSPFTHGNVLYHGQNDSLSHRINTVLDELGKSIKSFLDNVEYLGPIRPAPERTYMLKRADIDRWRTIGLNAWLTILQNGAFAPPPRIEETITHSTDESPMTKWLQELSLGKQLYIRRFADIPQSDLVAQIFILNSNNKWVNLLDVGYGTSQVLPIIATCLQATPGALILIEQPELHLHPGAQAVLGDLFIDAHNNSLEPIVSEQVKNGIINRLPSTSMYSWEMHKHGARFLIETHSEHLLLRLRRRVAETSAKTVPLDPTDFSISANITEIFFIASQGHENTSVTVQAKLNTMGDMSELPDDLNLYGFFADDLDETAALVSARIKIKSAEKN